MHVKLTSSLDLTPLRPLCTPLGGFGSSEPPGQEATPAVECQVMLGGAQGAGHCQHLVEGVQVC